jgi:hypothetical protein
MEARGQQDAGATTGQGQPVDSAKQEQRVDSSELFGPEWSANPDGAVGSPFPRWRRIGAHGDPRPDGQAAIDPLTERVVPFLTTIELPRAYCR